MGSEFIPMRPQPPSKRRSIIALVIIIMLFSNTFIPNSPLEIVDDSQASSTRGEGDDENTTTNTRETNRTRDGRRDSDNDGLNDEEELEMNTDPENPDTDSDGISDGQDYYPLDPSLWRSPVQIFMQVVLEIMVFLTLTLSYIAYRRLSKRKKNKEEE